MQVVYCKVDNCGFRSQNGFCLNRLTVINEQGVCRYITKPGWDKAIDPKWFNTYTPPQENQENTENLFLSKDGEERK